VLFFLITFAATWMLFLPLVLRIFSRQSDVGDLLSLGIAAPTITAFVLTAVIAGRAGVRTLWRQGLRWRVGAAWYALVVFGPALVYGASLAVAAALGVPPPAMDFSVMAVVSALVVGLLAGLSEEFGWSGFAFPGLQARYGFVWAGVVVGLTVALWHLPFFFVPGLPHYSANFALFMLAGIPLRMLFGWIYNGSGGSVLLMILFHASWNTWSELLSPPFAVAQPAWLTFTAILWLAAIAVLLANRAAARRPRPSVAMAAGT
jgi:membrane protease YdiL (CAAX protease family)